MSAADLERLRFAYSPMAEVAESLWMLSAGQIRSVHQGWYELTRERLRRIDTRLLQTVVPAHSRLAEFLFSGAVDPGTSISDQLQLVAECPPETLRADLETVWQGHRLPPRAERLLAEGPAGARRLADVLWRYWEVAIEPHWRQIRAVLDDDLAYRASRLTSGGIEALLADLHPDLSIQGPGLRIQRLQTSAAHELTGAGLLLVPSVFAWPHLVVFAGTGIQPSLVYGSRGVGALWESGAAESTDEDALGALLGRSRAAILTSLAMPLSTTELALELGQSPPSVSQHLSVLRRNGLVTSWRSGRRVLYRQTPLASSIVAASGVGPTAANHPA